ncbi:phosphopantetheine-binding protein, partial [Escherichia coli]|nr:phosphopantetheine-binding protein [Escherichia coli]
LKINAADIGKNDSFLQIGGDSISAIQLVSVAQQHGISLTIAKIFEDARLSRMAESSATTAESKTYETEPFALLPKPKTSGGEANVD